MDILSVTGIAFAVVIVTLAILAVMIKFIAVLFPERPAEDKDAVDPALTQAINQAVAAYLPGAQVVEIKEIGNSRR